MSEESYSLRKDELDPIELERLLEGKKIQEVIKRNLEQALGSEFIREGHGIFGVENFTQSFTFDGSLKTKDSPTEGRYSRFFKKDGRVLKKGDDFILRGVRYLVSIDPTLEVRQKLDILKTDFIEGIQILENQDAPPTSREHFIEQSAILDYIKNAAVTLLNSLIQQEKLGKFRLGDNQYQQLREKAIELAGSATQAYYAHLIEDNEGYETAFANLKNVESCFSDITAFIESQYLEGVFSSRYFTRPEASHPLVVACSVYTTAQNIKQTPQTIIGLPAGGTELALAQQYAYERLKGIKPILILVPLSLHSVKKTFDTRDVELESFHAYMREHKTDIENKHILIIEDNSSTGRTIQMLVDTIETTFGLETLSVAVAEADLIRSQVDKDSEKRTRITNPVAYEHAVDILPVSRTLKTKVDMKELAEKKRIAQTYRQKLRKAQTPEEQMMYRVFVQMCEKPTQEILHDLNEGNAILEFRYTFLSNFYATPIEYKGTIYPSVEHAYQAQKFTDTALASVSTECLEEINETFRTRGQPRTFTDARDIFTDTALSAGNIKVAADILRAYGFVRDNWDDEKIILMAHLLQNKFEDQEIQKRLLETGDKYLVEGNEWNDTLWGVSGGRGRNLLGLMLMDIRDRIKK